MRRRDFIKVIAAPAMGWPLAARAQSSTKMARIGMLYIGLADAESFKKELREALRELGYVEGQNIAFEFRSAEGKLDRLPGLASELVRLKVDVIVALYVPSALAAKQASSRPTQSKPASFPDLARPGGNITGISLMSAASNAKNIELFRDMLPSVRRVGVLGNTKDSVFAKAMLDEVLRAGGPTGTEIQPVMRIREPDEAESAFVAMVRERVDAVVIQGSLAIKSVTDLAIKYRLRTASSTRTFADIGGLMGPTRWRGADF